MNKISDSSGNHDIDTYMERMEQERVLRAIAGVRELEARHSPRMRRHQEVTELHDEIRRNMSEWAGL